MAALHTALQALSPTDFTSVPLHDLGGYLHETFSRAQVLIDSVPLPGPESVTPTARSRSNTVSSIASNASEISASSARSADPVPEHISLQKEWGKALKLGAKENPLGISVYKLSGKDGKGAWFARRSVHEGLGFAKWKRGLEREFPESMAVQGGPGQGNIRGIGGEKRVEREIVAGVGKMEVYHLSAQFPGPTTPRDFVTLLLTTDSALPNTSNGAHTSHPNTLSPSLSSTLQEPPRHYMVISKPCNHPSCPPRDGFIRGQYESVEYIREIPLKPGNRASRSTNDLRSAGTGTGGRTRASSIGREAMLRSATQRTATFPAQIDGLNGSKVAGQIPTPPPSPSSSLEVMAATEGRRRGATISYSAPRAARSTDGNLHVSHEEEDDESEMNPVEWIMITRSDPGGSVPRFMVERGTPGSIVADASKFLDWACSAEHPEGEDEIETVVEGSVLRKEEEKVDALHLNAHLSGIDGTTEGVEGDEHQQPTISGLSATNVTPAAPLAESATTKDTEAYQPTKEALAPPAAAPHQHSLYESVTSTLGAGLTAITPTMISSHFPTYHPSPRPSSLTRSSSASSGTSVTSTVSFATANSATSSQARTSNDRDSSPSSSALPNAADTPTAAAAALGEPSTDTTSLTKSSTAASTSAAAQDKELLKLQERRRKLDEKLEKSRLSLLPVPSTSSSSSTATTAAAGVPAPADPPPPAAWTKALASHARDVQKLELRYARELEKIQARRERDARKENEREKKRVDRDERAKLARERDEARSELARVRAERDALRVVVGELQRENTGLVARFGGVGGTAGGGGLDIGTGEGGSRAPTPRLA